MSSTIDFLEERFYKELERSKIALDRAISNSNPEQIIKYRGRYLFYLKSLYRLDNTSLIPNHISGTSIDIPVVDEIKKQLQLHQDAINNGINDPKNKDKFDKKIFPREVGLKFRRLATRFDQVNFATGNATKSEVLKDATSALVTSPILIASKVLSKLGPIAVTIAASPFTVFASLLAIANDVTREKPQGVYTDTPIHKLNKSLNDAVRTISKSIYTTVSKI